MTELVIRIDPARALHNAWCGTRDGVVRGWRYVERTWRLMHDQPVVTRLARADRKTHAKLAMGAIAVASMIVIYGASRAITATPPPQPALKQRLDDAAADTTKAVRKVDMAKPQVASLEPKPVKTERITPEMVVAPPPPPPPVVQQVQEEVLPPVMTRKRVRVAQSESNICTRHGMRKVVTRGGKSWRCRR